MNDDYGLLANAMRGFGAQPNPSYGGMGIPLPENGGTGMMQPSNLLTDAFPFTTAPATSGGAAPSRGFWGSALNQYGKNGEMTGQGWGAPALGAAQGLFSAYMGMKQYGLMKDQLSESKRQFGLNFDAQKNTTNAQLEDRQKARVASNPGAYESVDSYMDKYKVKG